MLLIYWICFVFGGIFVALSAMGGLEDAELDTELELEPMVGADSPEMAFELAGLEAEGLEASFPASSPIALASRFSEEEPFSASQPSFGSVALSFRILGKMLRFGAEVLFSVRFWTFSACFFGATGIALAQLNVDAATTLPLAIGLGLGLGAIIAGTLKVLYNRGANGLLETSALIGEVGTVELPFDANRQGRVRFTIDGVILDYIAYTEEEERLAFGQPVLAVNYDNQKLWVVAMEDLP
jgi:hypothetical protein